MRRLLQWSLCVFDIGPLPLSVISQWSAFAIVPRRASTCVFWASGFLCVCALCLWGSLIILRRRGWSFWQMSLLSVLRYGLQRRQSLSGSSLFLFGWLALQPLPSFAASWSQCGSDCQCRSRCQMYFFLLLGWLSVIKCFFCPFIPSNVRHSSSVFFLLWSIFQYFPCLSILAVLRQRCHCAYAYVPC